MLETYKYTEEETNDDLFEVAQVSKYNDQNEESITEVMDEIDIEDLSQVETDDMNEEAEFYPTSYDALTYIEDYWGHNLNHQERVSEKDIVEISAIYQQFLEIVSMTIE